MNQEIYANAPITEAALDIRVRSFLNRTPEDLLEASDDAYPVLFRKPTMGQVEILTDDEEQTISATASSTPLGFAYKSLDERQVYQYRTDGFTHNRLAPYQEWDSFVTEAQRLWKVYRDVMKPDFVELLGLNYINELLLPIGATIQDYFSTYVEVPKTLPQQLNVYSFAYQVTIPEGGFLHIAQGYGPPKKEGFATVLLNIQAFQPVSLPTAEEHVERTVWSTFESLRTAKSRAFEACITDKVREMIR